MIDNNEQIELLQLTRKKHYQKFHPKVMEYLNRMDNYSDVGVFHANTHDLEREDFILNSLNLKGQKILDIGANVGYFSLVSALAGASLVVAYESDSDDSRLIELQAKLLEFNDSVIVKNATYEFSQKISEKFDVVYCLNVLHHVGRYFDTMVNTKEQALEKIISYLNFFAKNSRYCVFQIGYNWKGEEGNPLFRDGTKTEVIDFIEKNTKDFWEILAIGIAESINGSIQYKEPNNDNLKRNDSLGEFLNRPLFILKSIKE
jgi:SAM-dependent methyltransferase